MRLYILRICIYTGRSIFKHHLTEGLFEDFPDRAVVVAVVTVFCYHSIAWVKAFVRADSWL